MTAEKASVIVVGGGIGGMTAAGALADLGLDVVIVEKENALGGNAGNWACMATTECARCSACTVQEHAGRVWRSPGIEVLTGAEVTRVDGGAGSFKVHVDPSGSGSLDGARDISASRILLATGFEPFDAGKMPLLSYGRLDEVSTTRDVDHLLRSDTLESYLPRDLEEPRIAFLQCVGSRDRARGRNYCSQFCCKATIRLAGRLLHLRPAARITVYYIDLQVMGKEFRSFHRRLEGKVRFLQGVPDQVDHGWDEDAGNVVLRTKDPVTGEATAEVFDRVILSVGIEAGPAARVGEVFEVGLDETGFLAAKGFRTDREGIYASGASIGPTDILGTRTQAMAVASAIAADLGVTAGTSAART